MTVFKFNDFVFDSESYRLVQNGQPVKMRPKALKLLSLLIKNRERVVSKAEIFSLVWGDAYARDHLLFQLISELRRAPFEPEFVRTQPNEGYRWVVPTSVELLAQAIPLRRKRAVLSQVAASLTLGIIVAAASSLVIQPNTSGSGTALLPAHSALTRGVIEMDAGRGSQAIEWFEFALKENPESIESSLLLAETLLLENKLEESSEHLHSLLLKPDLSSYNKMTVNDILSRIHQRQGSLNSALKYALRSSKEKGIAQCSVEIVEERIDGLASQLGFSQTTDQAGLGNLATGENSDTDSRRNTNVDQEIPVTTDYADQCNQLKPEPEETSYCPPDLDELYVYLKSADRFMT